MNKALENNNPQTEQTTKNKLDKAKVIDLSKRYLLFTVRLFISAMGVALTKKGELGVSPISSVANVLSLDITSITLGTWLIIWNCFLILGQILLLRKKFQLIQLLQIPLSFLFGYFTDICVNLVEVIPVSSYPMQLVMVVAGTIVLGLGIALSVIANVIMNSGEAFVKAVSDTINKDFGFIKVAFDIGCVVLAVVLSLLFFNFTVVGTREGTLIAAVCTGFVVKFFCTILKKIPFKLFNGGN